MGRLMRFLIIIMTVHKKISLKIKYTRNHVYCEPQHITYPKCSGNNNIMHFPLERGDFFFQSKQEKTLKNY